MSTGRFYVLIGAVFLAPHVSTYVGIGVSVLYTAIGFYLSWHRKEAA